MKNTPQASIPDYSKLVGIPYSKMNCFELAQKFYADVLGMELKNYYECAPTNRTEIQNLVYTSKGDFVEVDSPQFGDIVLIKIENLESHIAVYVGPDRILHTLTTTKESVVDRLSRWRMVVSGYYRMRDTDQ